MRRGIYILLSFLLLLQAGGLLLYYEAMQGYARHQMKQRLRANPGSSGKQWMTMSAEGYDEARTAEGELRVQGHLYDIVRVRRQGGHVRVLVVRDKEEELIAGIISGILGADDDTEIPGKLLDLLSFEYVTPATFALHLESGPKPPHFLHRDGYTLSRPQDTSSPPPDGAGFALV